VIKEYPVAISAPEWLKKHGGDVRLSNDQRYWVVYVAGGPQYLIRPIPAAGKHAVEVEQSVNGKRLEGKETYPSEESAIQGGLEDLRKALGW
jgi:hypothetical protein